MNAVASPTRRFRPLRPRVRRGGATGGLIATLAVFGTLSAAAVIITPQLLSAGAPTAPLPVAARSPAHQQVIDLLGSLIGRSHAVLAIHPRGPTPFHEIVLWLEDRENLGRVDADEVAVLWHSETLQTISLAAVEEGEEQETDDVDADPVSAPAALDPGSGFGHSFCTAWRRRPDVTRRVLAGGVAGMEVQPGEGASRLILALTWASDSTDGADKASVLVDARAWPGTAGTE